MIFLPLLLICYSFPVYNFPTRYKDYSVQSPLNHLLYKKSPDVSVGAILKPNYDKVLENIVTVADIVKSANCRASVTGAGVEVTQVGSTHPEYTLGALRRIRNLSIPPAEIRQCT